MTDQPAQLVRLPAPDGRWAFRHRCDRTASGRGVYVLAVPLHPDHRVSDDGATVTPSILCPDCGTHGYWTGGRWAAV